ncbi:hypothetical protein ACFQY0_16565 [Haloferula chungangensis]|uniref:Uncharacterized protein n=1 Tax=Haloferula chungangensis TaxID=1048331 RepID=A0ABW2LDD1_9BACT
MTIVTLALGYIGVDWYGKKVWTDTVEELNGAGYPSTIEEAVEPSAKGRVDLFEIQTARDEVARFENDDEGLGDLSSLGFPGLRKDVYLDIEEGPDGPQFAAFYGDGISNGDAAEKLFTLFERYEERRKLLLLVRPDRLLLMDSKDGPSGFTFLNRATGFLFDHALTSIAVGRSDVAMEDLETMIAWSHAIDQTPQMAIGYALAASYRMTFLVVINEGLMAGSFGEDDLEKLSKSLSQFDLQRGYRKSLVVEISGWIESYDPIMQARPEVDWDTWCANWSLDREILGKKAMSLVYAHGPEGIHAMGLEKALRTMGDEAAKTGDVSIEDLTRFRSEHASKPRYYDLDLDDLVLEPPLSEGVWEFLEMTAHSCLVGEAQMRLTQTAIDLEIRRLKEGKFPDSVQAEDPLGDGVMGYRLEKDGGYSIWSVGPDGVDDGGAGDDLVFRYWVR